MLNLNRKQNESVIVDGNIKVTFIRKTQTHAHFTVKALHDKLEQSIKLRLGNPYYLTENVTIYMQKPAKASGIVISVDAPMSVIVDREEIHNNR